MGCEGCAGGGKGGCGGKGGGCAGCSGGCGKSSELGDSKELCAVVQAGRRLYEKGLIAGPDGNLSLRAGNGVVVSPAGAHKGVLRCGDLSLVSLEGRHLAGGRPTTELALHLEVFRLRPDVRAVVHAHAPTCVAMTLMRHPVMDGVLPEITTSLGGFKVVPYARTGTDSLAKVAAEALLGFDAVVLERHGTLAVGRTLDEAISRTEALEHGAKILWMAHCMQRPSRLPEQELRALREIYDRGRHPTAGMAG